MGKIRRPDREDFAAMFENQEGAENQVLVRFDLTFLGTFRQRRISVLSDFL
jgi:hypothetical protein